jgi:hypothetical protein
MTTCVGIYIVKAYVWLHVSALISHQRTTTDDKQSRIGSRLTEFYTLHVCTVYQQYLNTIYFQLWRTQLKLQNVKTAKKSVNGSDMFRFTTEPSSGSSLYFAKKLPFWLHIVVLCSRTTFNVLAVYGPVCGCMVHFVGANWWFHGETKHVGAVDRFLAVLIFCNFNCVRHSWK